MEPPKLRGYEYDSDLVDRYVETGKILILYLAYNSKCNLSCAFCFSNGGRRITTSMTRERKSVKGLQPDDFENLVDQGAKLGIRSVCFYGEGEPLLKGDMALFFELVEYVNRKHLIPVVFTNGVTITETVAKKLYDNNVSVVGKLYSFDPEVNEILTGYHRIYKYELFNGKEVPSHIPHLMDAGYEGTDRFALFTVVTKHNYQEIGDIWKWERTLGIIPYVDFLYTYRHQKDYGISDNEKRNLCKSLHEYDKSLGFDYAFHFGSHAGHRMCNTRIAAVVGANGELRLCPAVDVYVGNVRKASLARLLIERDNLARRMHFEGEDRGKCGAYRLEESRSRKSKHQK